MCLAQWEGPCLSWYSQLYRKKEEEMGRKERGGETGRQTEAFEYIDT